MPFLASAVTFDALLWMLPFVLLVLAGAGYLVFGAADDPATLHALLVRFLPAEGAEPFQRVERVLTEMAQSRGQLSLAALPLFVWFSMRLFGSVRAALNDVFDTEESRAYWLAKLLDLYLGSLTAVLVTANILVTTLYLPDTWPGRFLGTVIAYISAVALFFTVYRMAPSRHVRWDTALVAAVFSSLAFEVAKRLFAIYLAEFVTVDRVISNANAIALLLFVLWVYYTSWVFLAGGEVAETYDLGRRQREQREALS